MEINETTKPLMVLINIFSIVVGGMIGISLITLCASKLPDTTVSSANFTINLMSSDCSSGLKLFFNCLLVFYFLWILLILVMSIYLTLMINTLMIIRSIAYSIIIILNWANLIDPVLRLFFMSNGIYGEANFNCYCYIYSSFILMYLAMFSAIFLCFELYAEFRNFDKERFRKLEVSFLLTTIIISLFGLFVVFVDRDLLDSVKLRGVMYEEIQNYLYLNQSEFLDTLQIQLQCCGENGWEDYIRKIDGAQLVPLSCVEPYLNISCIDQLIPFNNRRWIFTISSYIIYIIFQIMAIIWNFNSEPRIKISYLGLKPYIQKANEIVIKR